jgi:hypothetical protein
VNGFCKRSPLTDGASSTDVFGYRLSCWTAKSSTASCTSYMFALTLGLCGEWGQSP